MAGFQLEVDAALGALQHLMGDTQDKLQRHVSVRPRFEVTATVRDYSDYGAALAEMFEKLHGGVQQRIDAMLITADAAAKEVHRFATTDAKFAETVHEVGRGEK